MTRDQIIAALPQLSKADLAAVFAAATMLTIPSEPAPDWLLPAIAQYLLRKGLVTPSDTYWMRRSKEYKVYAEKSTSTLVWLNALLTSDRLRPVLASIAVDAFAGWLNQRGIFCRETMLSQIDRLPEALCSQFPGYYEAGMFPMILSGELSHATHPTP